MKLVYSFVATVILLGTLCAYGSDNNSKQYNRDFDKTVNIQMFRLLFPTYVKELSDIPAPALSKSDSSSDSSDDDCYTYTPPRYNPEPDMQTLLKGRAQWAAVHGARSLGPNPLTDEFEAYIS